MGAEGTQGLHGLEAAGKGVDDVSLTEEVLGADAPYARAGARDEDDLRLLRIHTAVLCFCSFLRPQR